MFASVTLTKFIRYLYSYNSNNLYKYTVRRNCYKNGVLITPVRGKLINMNINPMTSPRML